MMSKESKTPTLPYSGEKDPVSGEKKDPVSGEEKKRLDLFDEKEERDLWGELRCPICLDHPHSAVLLTCSSHDEGCRPYMCDAIDSLSNCFHQFCKQNSAIPSESGNIFVVSDRGFRCPLCRGEITGWTVAESVRKFMDELGRSCSVDCCEFSGNYRDLKEHTENEHPAAADEVPRSGGLPEVETMAFDMLFERYNELNEQISSSLDLFC